MARLAIKCSMTNARRTRFARCSRCGREFRARARFCPHCGVAVKIDGGKVSVPAVEKDPVAETAVPSPPAMPLSVMAEIAATPPAPRQPAARQAEAPPVVEEPGIPARSAAPQAATLPAPPAPAVIPRVDDGRRPPLLLAPLVLLLALAVFLFAWLANR